MSDSIVTKIQALFDKAASSEFAPEREAFRAKAQELMEKNAIEEYQLDEARAARGESKLSKPETREFLLPNTGSKWGWEIRQLLVTVVGGTGGRLLRKPVERRDGVWVYPYTLVGFRSELVYAEMLFMSLQLEMLKALEPETDPALSYDANVYLLHEAGFKWAAMYPLMRAYCETTGAKLQPESSLKRAYHRECARRNEEPTPIISHNTYQESFAEGFIYKVWDRLDDRNREPGTALVLRSREADVDALFQTLLPPPVPVDPNAPVKKVRVAKYKPRAHSSLGAARGREAGAKADLSSPGSRVSGSPVGRIG